MSVQTVSAISPDDVRSSLAYGYLSAVASAAERSMDPLVEAQSVLDGELKSGALGDDDEFVEAYSRAKRLVSFIDDKAGSIAHLARECVGDVDDVMFSRWEGTEVDEQLVKNVGARISVMLDDAQDMSQAVSDVCALAMDMQEIADQAEESYSLALALDEYTLAGSKYAAVGCVLVSRNLSEAQSLIERMGV